MSELNDAIMSDHAISGEDICYWTQDLCWHPEFPDCNNCPEKEINPKHYKEESNG